MKKLTGQRRIPPVRVALLRADAYAEQTAPPDGESKDWWSRLNKALGTVSPDFARASLLQLQGAARSPYGTISEMAINAALAMIEAAAPRNELEGALAVQMAATHAAAMSVLAKMDSAFGTERRTAAFGSTAARLLKAYAMQLEVLRRLRTGGQASCPRRACPRERWWAGRHRQREKAGCAGLTSSERCKSRHVPIVPQAMHSFCDRQCKLGKGKT